mmetsp:Transcript_18731/g.52928  ORF Transcript_18731/g.52928 Transcript_18731/m.52928 type:complete len:212 (-) Transcript_18731:198-833(-)
MPPPMSRTRTCSLPRKALTSSASSTVLRTPAASALTPELPLPTWTWMQFSQGYLLKAAMIDSFSLTGIPNLESGVETESASMAPAPTRGFTRRPTEEEEEAGDGASSARTAATTSSSCQLSTLMWTPAPSACLISAAVFTGESNTVSEPLNPIRCACETSPKLAHSAPKPSSRARLSILLKPLDFRAKVWKNPGPKALLHSSRFASHASRS